MAEVAKIAKGINMAMVTNRSTPILRLQGIFIDKAGEWFFALFLFGGYFKADPRLAFIQTHIDITLLFLCLSFLVFLYRILKCSFKVKIPRTLAISALLFLLLGICLIGCLLHTQSIQYGFDKTMRFVFLTGWAFFGAVFLISDFQSIKRFSLAIVAVSATMAIYALLSHLTTGQIGFVTAFGSNYIALARACGLGLFANLLFLLPTEERPFIKFCLWIIATLQLYAMLSAGARGPVLSFILSLFLFFVLSIKIFPWPKIDRFALRLFVLAILAAIVLTMVGQKLFPTLVFRMRVLLTEVGSSAAMRIDLCRAALYQFARSPIWGAGTGQFGMAVTGQDIRLYPHNIILELAAETGILGVLVFVTMIGVSLAEGFIRLRGKGLTEIIAKYLLVATCFNLLNAMVSGDINDNRILFTFIALLSVSSRFY